MDPQRSTSGSRVGPFLRFVAVGPVGFALSAAQYELLWMLNPLVTIRAGSTWVASSLLGVAWVHAMHCHFTFAGTARGRWRATLGRAYLLYATSIALGSVMMHVMVDQLGWQRTGCWLVTTSLCSLLNFTLLHRLVGQPIAQDPASSRQCPAARAADGREALRSAGEIVAHVLAPLRPDGEPPSSRRNSDETYLRPASQADSDRRGVSCSCAQTER
jgi:putative flippase GtrA